MLLTFQYNFEKGIRTLTSVRIEGRGTDGLQALLKSYFNFEDDQHQQQLTEYMFS